MNTEDDSREQGVEFGSLADELETEEYPLRKEALLAAHGDAEIELEDGAQTLREILEPLGEETYDSPEDVKQSVIGMAGDEAIGRKGYSDRGGTVNKEGSEESV